MKLLIKKFPIFESNPYLSFFFSVSIIVFVFGSILFTFTHLLPSTQVVIASEVKWVPPPEAPILEVHIANNGMVYLQGAKVESIGETVLTVSTSWNNIKLLWIIHTDESYYDKRHFGTDFFDSKGTRISIEDIRVGSFITVSGTFDVRYAEPTIKADVVRM